MIILTGIIVTVATFVFQVLAGLVFKTSINWWVTALSAILTGIATVLISNSINRK